MCTNILGAKWERGGRRREREGKEKERREREGREEEEEGFGLATVFTFSHYRLGFPRLQQDSEIKSKSKGGG